MLYFSYFFPKSHSSPQKLFTRDCQDIAICQRQAIVVRQVPIKKLCHSACSAFTDNFTVYVIPGITLLLDFEVPNMHLRACLAKFRFFFFFYLQTSVFFKFFMWFILYASVTVRLMKVSCFEVIFYND